MSRSGTTGRMTLRSPAIEGTIVRARDSNHIDAISRATIEIARARIARHSQRTIAVTRTAKRVAAVAAAGADGAAAVATGRVARIPAVIFATTSAAGTAPCRRRLEECHTPTLQTIRG